ncbi:MAG: CaiB/BaiF CoA transferase family protein [Dehalococcoidia bacterium]
MEGPLAGIRVLEVANFLAVPSAAALMADMGADVIKVEPPEGDTYRLHRGDADFNFDFPTSYGFELDNRGKRSIVLNLRRTEAVEVVWKLAERADVFMTNLLPRRKERYRLRYQDLSRRNPRLVYLVFSGYGPEGPDKDRPAFDYTAFWARSGVMSLYSDPNLPPLQLRPGMGDHAASPLLLAGVLAALLVRERSGKGQEITASLLNMGFWVVAADVQRTLVAGQEPRYYRRATEINPLRNTYRTSDGRWINLVMFDREANWTSLCEALGSEGLVADPRYKTPDDRKARCEELVKDLDKIFASMTMDELASRFDAHGVIWAPKQSLLEAIDDPQVKANDFFKTLQHPTHGPYRTLNTPIHFSDSEVGAKAPAPELGQHTKEVLQELGYTWQEIEDLRSCGAIS